MWLVRSIIKQRRAEPGYFYPMGWIAWFGMTVPVVFVANQFVQAIVFSLSIYMTLWAIGFLGTIVIVFESCRNLWRYRFLGFGRPRFYFEVGRLIICLLILILASLLSVGIFFPAAAKQAFFLFVWLRAFVYGLCALFFAVGVFGHSLSLATGRRVSGRAYECTTFFVTLVGGIGLTTFGYLIVPEQNPDIATFLIGWGLFFSGLLLVLVGFLIEINRDARSKEKRK